MAFFWSTAAVIVVLLSSLVVQADEAALGISKTQPESGPFVKIDDGYMVPYSLTIPSTEIKIDMVPIPGGTAKIGSPPDEAGRLKDEGPQFEVTVEPLWVGKYEITWEQYTPYMNLYYHFKAFETEGVRKVDDKNVIDAVTAPTPLHEPTHTYEYGQRPRQSAVTMTPIAAKHYTKWLSLQTGHWYRLPTEAEWEYAARGGTKSAYSFDDPEKVDDYAWTKSNISDVEGQRDVGQKLPNPFGLYDMHGNVWEWTLDGYQAEGYVQQAGKQLDVWKAVAWPKEADSRVARGGSWEFGPDRARSAARLCSEDEDWKEYDPQGPLSPWWYTSDPARGVGFRLVRQLKPLTAELRQRVWEADHEVIKDDIEYRLEVARQGALGVVDKDLAEAIRKLEE